MSSQFTKYRQSRILNEHDQKVYDMCRDFLKGEGLPTFSDFLRNVDDSFFEKIQVSEQKFLELANVAMSDYTELLFNPFAKLSNSQET